MNETPVIRSLGDACCGCSACASVCPVGAIALEADGTGFRYPRVDEDVCVRCGRCDKACPSLSPGARDEVNGVKWIQSRDCATLARSSSGGVFSLVASRVIEDGGVVSGALFCDGGAAVCHGVTGDLDGLVAMRGSKYLQSSIDKDMYKDLKNRAKGGQTVLFTGTPCQVAGFNGALGEVSRLPNVYSMAVMCHGVPSPRLWREYLAWLVGAHSADVVKDIRFRDKEDGWGRSRVVVALDGGDTDDVSERFGENWFMRAFLGDACLRPSCYDCTYKSVSGSDLVVGDFWGFDAAGHGCQDPALGVSAVVENTEKGQTIRSSVMDGAFMGEADYREVLEGNPALVKSPRPHPGKDAFMEELAAGTPVEVLMSRWSFEPTLSQVVARKVRGALRRISRLV